MRVEREIGALYDNLVLAGEVLIGEDMADHKVVRLHKFGATHPFDPDAKMHEVVKEMFVSTGQWVSNTGDPLALRAMNNDMARTILSDMQAVRDLRIEGGLMQAFRKLGRPVPIGGQI